MEKASSAKKKTKKPKKEKSVPAQENVAPGAIPETTEVAPPSRTATFVDTNDEQLQGPASVNPGMEASVSEQTNVAALNEHPRAEEMGEQEEVPFPMTTAKPKHKASDDKEEPVKPKTRVTTTVTETEHEFEGRDFASLNPKDYGIEFSEEPLTYEPPPDNSDDLPDIYRLMASLEEGENQLAAAKEPPSLYNKPEQVNYYRKITEKKTELEEGSDIEDYLNNFLEGVRDDVLMIGQISLEEVQDEEKRLRDEHISYVEQQKRMEQLIRHKMLILEEEAKKRIAQYLKEKRLLMKKMAAVQQQKEKMLLDRLNKAFRKSENQLKAVLEWRKAEIKTYYGDLTSADGHYGGSKGRRWKVDWDKTPQPIQVKLKCLRGVKDKLPGGRYVVMVSLYNRLGGHVLRWSRLRGQMWGGATLPVSHDGMFYNVEIKLDQSVFTALPAKAGVKPGMVLVFELFLLRGAVVSTDRVVGWGCFPIADSNFDIVEGKFKCPFLRGEMDDLLDKHEKIEGLMASDLDHWLCNCYFEVVKLPRYLAGQKEYEVELQFSSGIIAFPDRIHTGEEYRDGEAPVPGSLDDVKTLLGSENIESKTTLGSALLQPSTSLDSDDESDRKLPLDVTKDELKKLGKEDSFTDLRKRRPFSSVGSRRVHNEKKFKATAADSDGGSDYEEEDVYLMKKESDFYPVKGHPGMWYKQHEQDPVDEYHKKMFALLPKTPVLTERRKRRKLTHLEQLEEHSFSVKKVLSDKGRAPRESEEKMQYVGRMLLSEMGLSQWRSREFWGMMIMFILTFFLRIFVHYVFQWLFLQALNVPVNKFNMFPYTVELNYQTTLLSTAEETCVVFVGPFGNVFLLSALVFASWLMQRLFGMFPDVGSKFVLAYGIQTFFDPLFILIVDVILNRHKYNDGGEPIADAAKLYYYFDQEGNSFFGILITIFVYIFVAFLAAAIIYMYFLRLHNNGRMLDIYWRLMGKEEIFFLPYDLEVSNEEMAYLARKSEQWRGEEGERRKVGVYDYVWEEEEIDDGIWDENESVEDRPKNIIKSEITTHVSIHTLHLDGLRELYRHFLRLPDGGIVEIFGDMSVAGMDKDMKTAIDKGAKNMENIFGSQTTIGRAKSAGTTAYSKKLALEEDL